MEYEGKNKIFYIGTAVLFVLFILLYVGYFLFNKPVTSKRNTSEAIAVKNARETEAIDNGEEIIEDVEKNISLIEKPEEKETNKTDNNVNKKVETNRRKK